MIIIMIIIIIFSTNAITNELLGLKKSWSRARGSVLFVRGRQSVCIESTGLQFSGCCGIYGCLTGVQESGGQHRTRAQERACLGGALARADAAPVSLQSIIFDEVDLTDASVAESSTKNVNNSFTVRPDSHLS